MVTGWRSPADGVTGLGGLTVQAHCLSGYSHYPPPQPPAQLSPNQRVILWLALGNGNGARARSYCWRDIPSYMQIRTIRKGFEAIEWKFERFERDLNYSNANSNHSKRIGSIRMQIRSIRMQIRTTRKGFESFECKFEAFDRDSRHSKGIRSIRMQIRTTRKGLEAFEYKFEPLERDWKHSNANSKHSNTNSKHSNANSNNSKQIPSIRMQIRSILMQIRTISKFEAFESDSKHSNANSSHSKGIRSIRMEIRTIRKGFEAFE